MKNTNLSTKLVMAITIVVVLVYFGTKLASFFIDPFSTTLAYSYTAENAITVSGYVVREEEPIAVDSERMYFFRSEGERVSKGGSVALQYDTVQILRDANRLRTLEEQLEQLLYAQTLVNSVSATSSLDQEVNTALTNFHVARANGTYGTVAEACTAVRAAILRHSYAYSGTEELNRSIASLQSEITSLSASVSGATTAVRAPQTGLFSSLVDGYESVLTPESLQNMTPEDYRDLAPQKTTTACKLVYGSKWYFVTLLRATDAKHLNQGDTVTLRFHSGLDRDLTLTVERLSAEEGGQCLLVLSSDKNLHLTTLLRRQNAQLIFARYDGIRVPRSAVRIVWETVKDADGTPIRNADGTEKQQQSYVVYCVWGKTSRLKKINILWQEDEYMIVESADTNDPKRLLRAGDQVITAAADLYDGKVIE